MKKEKKNNVISYFGPMNISSKKKKKKNNIYYTGVSRRGDLFIYKERCHRVHVWISAGENSFYKGFVLL